MLQLYYIVDDFKALLKKSRLILGLLLPLGLILASCAQADYRTDLYSDRGPGPYVQAESLYKGGGLASDYRQDSGPPFQIPGGSNK